MMGADDVSTGPGEFVASAPRATVMRPAAGHSVFLPALLFAIALVGWLGFQCSQQWIEHQQLAALQQSLGPQEETAKKLRVSLESVATATAKLASDGNVNARVIVEELRKRGVTINAPGAPTKQ